MDLSEIREAARKKFGGQFLEIRDGEKVVRFRNGLRIDDKTKTAVDAIEEKYTNLDRRGIGTMADLRREVLLAVAENKQDAKQLLSKVDDDADVYALYDAWQDVATGEASTSQDS